MLRLRRSVARLLDKRRVVPSALIAFGGLALAFSAVRAATRPVVAVFQIEVRGQLELPELGELTDIVAARLVAGGQYKTVPSSQIAAALSAKKKDSYRDCYEQSCQIEIGKELAAEKALATKIVRLGKSCIVTMQMYDLRESAASRAAVTRGGCTIDAILTSLDGAVLELTGTSGSTAVATSPPPRTSPPPPLTRTSPPPPQSSSPRLDTSGRRAGRDAADGATAGFAKTGPTGSRPNVPNVVNADTKQQVWNRLKRSKARARQLPLKQAIYSRAELSPDGGDLYVHRLHKVVKFARKYQLFHMDLKTSALTKLSNVGVDTYVMSFLNGITYTSREVEKYKSRYIMAFRGTRPVPLPFNDRVFYGMVQTTARALVISDKKRSMTYYVPGQRPVESSNGPFYSVRYCHPQREFCLSYNFPKDTDGNGKRDYRDASQFYAFSFDQNGRALPRRKVLPYDRRRKVTSMVALDYDRLVIVMSDDTNGDGIANYKDRRNDSLHLFDIRTGRTREIYSAKSDFRGVFVHPSGLILFGETFEKNGRVSLRLLDPSNGRDTTARAFHGPGFTDMKFSKDWRRMIYKRVHDTKKDGKYYDWEDESTLFVVDF